MGNWIRIGGETPGCFSARTGFKCGYQEVDEIISGTFWWVQVSPISNQVYPILNWFSKNLVFSVVILSFRAAPGASA
jgi:hypothetical protein